MEGIVKENKGKYQNDSVIYIFIHSLSISFICLLKSLPIQMNFSK